MHLRAKSFPLKPLDYIVISANYLNEDCYQFTSWLKGYWTVCRRTGQPPTYCKTTAVLCLLSVCCHICTKFTKAVLQMEFIWLRNILEALQILSR